MKPGTDPPRRLRRQLQRRLVFDHRTSARRAAAVRGHQQQHRHGGGSAQPDGSVRRRFARRDDEQLRRGQELRARPRADGERGPVARHQAGAGTSAAATPTRAARSLDIVRAPNRGPDGLRIEGVAAVRVADRRKDVGPARRDRPRIAPAGQGYRRRVSYTLAKSRDNASSIGGGGATNVAQDDQDLAAEWGLSTFDRRHQLSANLSVELPFGPNRPWLTAAGPLAGAAPRLAVRDDVHVAVGHAVHGARPGRRRGRRAGHEWHAARRTTTGSRFRLGDRDNRSVLQHQRVQRAAARHVRHRRRAT